MFRSQKSVSEVLDLASQAGSQRDRMAARAYLDTRERVVEAKHNRPPEWLLERPDDVDPALWDAVAEQFDNDESYAA